MLKKNKFLYLIIILVSIYVFLPLNPITKYYLDTDGTGFLYIGQLILDGKAPYVDAWDHKPPGIYFIYALAILLGDGRWGIWILGIISLSVSSILGFKLMRRFYGLFPAVSATLMYLAGFNILRKGADYPEVFVLPLQFAILYLFISSARKKSFSYKYIVIGLLSALCFLLKQTLIGIPLSVLIYWLVVNKSNKDWSTVLVRVAGFSIGFILGLLPVFGYLFYHHAMKSFLDNALIYNISYIGTTLLDKVISINRLFIALSNSFLPALAIPTWFVSVITLVRRKKLDKEENLPLIYLILISFPLEISLAGISGRTFKHYFLPLLPSLMILAGFFFSIILTFDKTQLSIKRFEEKNVFLKIWVITFITLFPLVYIVRGNIGEIHDRAVKHKEYDQKYGQLIEYIEKNTGLDDYICFLGERVTFNNITGRKYPSRHINYFERYVEEFMDDLRTNKPVLIIFNKEPYWGWGSWGEFPFRLMETLRPYLDLNYFQVEPQGLDDFAIFKLRLKE
jgi:hypothetical protein